MSDRLLGWRIPSVPPSLVPHTPVAVDPLRRMWRYRALLRNLVARDLRVRYRNSMVGVGWSLLSPLLMMLVFTFVFTVLLRSAPTSAPYPAFLLAGILPWNFFSNSLLGALVSITGNASLIGKVSFPRETLPVSIVLANAVNFLLAVLVLVPVTLAFGIAPSPLWLLFPVILLGQLLFVLGVAFIVAAVNVHLRDTEYVAEIVLLAWFFLTPVFYDMSQVFTPSSGPSLSDVMLLVNPMAAFITQYRDIVLMHVMPDPVLLVRSFAIGLLTCLIGWAVFQRLSRSFGDVL
jgi:ABC-type polysaccharide/polyol phosphate export permease